MHRVSTLLRPRTSHKFFSIFSSKSVFFLTCSSLRRHDFNSWPSCCRASQHLWQPKSPSACAVVSIQAVRVIQLQFLANIRTRDLKVTKKKPSQQTVFCVWRFLFFCKLGLTLSASVDLSGAECGSWAVCLSSSIVSDDELSSKSVTSTCQRRLLSREWVTLSALVTLMP